MLVVHFLCSKVVPIQKYASDPDPDLDPDPDIYRLHPTCIQGCTDTIFFSQYTQ